MSSRWLTPEEIEARRKLKKLCLYLLLPAAAILIGAVTAILSRYM